MSICDCEPDECCYCPNGWPIPPRTMNLKPLLAHMDATACHDCDESERRAIAAERDRDALKALLGEAAAWLRDTDYSEEPDLSNLLTRIDVARYETTGKGGEE